MIDWFIFSIQSALGGRFVSQPRCELFTSTVPLLANLKPKGIPAHLLNSIVGQSGKIY